MAKGSRTTSSLRPQLLRDFHVNYCRNFYVRNALTRRSLQTQTILRNLRRRELISSEFTCQASRKNGLQKSRNLRFAHASAQADSYDRERPPGSGSRRDLFQLASASLDHASGGPGPGNGD